MTDPAQLFQGIDAGVARLWQGPATELVAAAAGRPQLWWLRGTRMRSRRGLMDEWAAAAQFPPHFGGTWDALRDALSDLPDGGTFLVLEADQMLQEGSPGELDILLAVLRDSGEDLAPKPFRVIFQAEADAFDALARRLPPHGQR